jgi:hypothetical protein
MMGKDIIAGHIQEALALYFVMTRSGNGPNGALVDAFAAGSLGKK